VVSRALFAIAIVLIAAIHAILTTIADAPTRHALLTGGAPSSSVVAAVLLAIVLVFSIRAMRVTITDRFLGDAHLGQRGALHLALCTLGTCTKVRTRYYIYIR
jgi:hypothetical protein